VTVLMNGRNAVRLLVLEAGLEYLIGSLTRKAHGLVNAP
jgi:hypothetical protein